MLKMFLRVVSVLEDKYRNIFGKIFVFDININIKLKDIFKDIFIFVCLKVMII